jgi:DNA-binding HxlR family transcriptional regulator
MSQKNTLAYQKNVNSLLFRALESLGGKHGLLIVREVMYGEKRFSELEHATGINTRTLTLRLSELQQSGVLSRRVTDDTPPQAIYAITKKGSELEVIVDELRAWAERWNG